MQKSVSQEPRPPSEADKDATLQLWGKLWLTKPARNSRNHEWKYGQNSIPGASVVRIIGDTNKVVGAVGAQGNRWSVAGRIEAIPCLGDIIVDTDRRGSTSFGQLVESISTTLAAAGVDRMYIFGSGAYVPHLAMTGWHLVQTIATAELKLRSSKSPSFWRRLTPFGRPPRTRTLGQARIVTRRSPRPAQMAELVERLDLDALMTQVRDSAFYEYRYRNPLSHYRFLYCYKGAELRGFIALQVHAREVASRDVSIVEWEALDDSTRSLLLEAAASSGVNTLHAWATDHNRAELETAGFVLSEPSGRLTTDASLPNLMVRNLTDAGCERNGDWHHLHMQPIFSDEF